MQYNDVVTTLNKVMCALYILLGPLESHNAATVTYHVHIYQYMTSTCILS